MARFLPANLFQTRLLPTDPTQWIEQNDLIFYVIAIVDSLNLSYFYNRYSKSDWGGKGYDPKTLLIITIMGYAEGCRHTRKIETFCKNDIRLRSFLGDTTPDHPTISRFLVSFQPVQ